MLLWRKSILMSSHCTARLSSCWYDTTVTPNTSLLGATKRLCCISETLHQIHGRDVLTWIFYLLSACHLLSWRTHNAPHLRQTVCHRTSAYGASACTVSPVFRSAQFYHWHFCSCKLPAVKTKVSAPPNNWNCFSSERDSSICLILICHPPHSWWEESRLLMLACVCVGLLLSSQDSCLTPSSVWSVPAGL